MSTRTRKLVALTASLAVALAALLSIPEQGRAQGPGSRTPGVASAAVPGAGIAVLHAQTFHLAESYEHAWCAERPRVQSGWLLVLDVPPELARQRALATPVLQVGDRIPERINQGWPDGRLVVLVPGAVDLAAAPIFFGPAALPETIDARAASLERDRALAAGVTPRPAGELDAALSQGGSRGGPALVLPDHGALRRRAAELVLLHAPSEHELVEGILAPPPERARVRRAGR